MSRQVGCCAAYAIGYILAYADGCAAYAHQSENISISSSISVEVEVQAELGKTSRESKDEGEMDQKVSAI